MKKLVLFDFDGTLADTSQGILACHRHALSSCGRAVPSEAILRSVIGAPLLRSYIEVFGFGETDARKAVEIYRERYAAEGMYEVVTYPGMTEVLHLLRQRGHLLGVATLKAHRFLEPMFEVLGLDGMFDVWHGMDDRDGLTKALLIKDCIKDVGANPEETVLIGDSVYDRDGALSAGVDFIGVSYGFGFGRGDVSCEAPADILKLL